MQQVSEIGALSSLYAIYSKRGRERSELFDQENEVVIFQSAVYDVARISQEVVGQWSMGKPVNAEWLGYNVVERSQEVVGQWSRRVANERRVAWLQCCRQITNQQEVVGQWSRIVDNKRRVAWLQCCLPADYRKWSVSGRVEFPVSTEWLGYNVVERLQEVVGQWSRGVLNEYRVTWLQFCRQITGGGRLVVEETCQRAQSGLATMSLKDYRKWSVSG
ncbi:hypothetical protein J6590_072337 [Homalodisca vitripennis]|nr:hypothetical protein J6590_072337 [Homalodisca vitripennis]